MKHLKARYFTGGSAWNDPEKITFNILLAVVYMVGLLAFQKYTGLLDLKAKPEGEQGKLSIPFPIPLFLSRDGSTC